MIKELIDELNRIEQTYEDNRECLVLDDCKVYLLSEKQTLSLPDYCETNNIKFDAGYAGCYLTPGNKMTVKSAILRGISRTIVSEANKLYIKGQVSEEELSIYNQYIYRY